VTAHWRIALGKLYIFYGQYTNDQIIAFR